MAKSSELVDYLLEMLASVGDGLGGVRARAMFGGYGLYRDDLMFALVADDVLYLKADATTRHEFEARDLPPFTYEKQGREYAMSYFLAPEEALEDQEELERWVRMACEAALRSPTRKTKR